MTTLGPAFIKPDQLLFKGKRSTENNCPVCNFTPPVTKFCDMWEGQPQAMACHQGPFY